MHSIKNDSVTRPVSHEDLRALLSMVEKAIEKDDLELIGNLQIISHLISSEHEDVRIYMCGEYDKLAGENNEYRMYDDDDIKISKDYLEKLAYGDFNEAMWALEHDLKNVSHTNSRDSDIFKSDYFADNDREIWEELRQVIINPKTDKNDDDLEIEAADALCRLREYQQKSYGPLVPVMFVNYVKNEKDNRIGISFRLAWIDNHVHVQAEMPYRRELDDFFTNKNPISDVADFNKDNIPKAIDGYKLESVDDYKLFYYEL